MNLVTDLVTFLDTDLVPCNSGWQGKGTKQDLQTAGNLPGVFDRKWIREGFYRPLSYNEWPVLGTGKPVFKVPQKDWLHEQAGAVVGHYR
jgi:hypothetical protein